MPNQNYVTRGELIQTLLQWQRNELSTQQLWDWSSHRFSGGVDYDDSEEDGSATEEVLSLLDSLDMHFILVEDVPIHLTFLYTPLGELEEGRRSWREALEAIDVDARRRRLKDDPIYALFCN